MSVSLAKAFDDGVDAARRGWRGVVCYVLVKWAFVGCLGVLFLGTVAAALWTGFNKAVPASLIGSIHKLLSSLREAAASHGGDTSSALSAAFQGQPAFHWGGALAVFFAGGAVLLCLGLAGHVWGEAAKASYVARLVSGGSPRWMEFFAGGNRFFWRSLRLLGLYAVLTLLLMIAWIAPAAVLGITAGKAGVAAAVFWIAAGLVALVYVMTRWSFGLSSLVVSDLSPRESLRRSWSATRGAFWRAFGLFALYLAAFCGLEIGCLLAGWLLIRSLGAAGVVLTQITVYGVNYFGGFALYGMLISFYMQRTESDGGFDPEGDSTGISF